MFSFILNEDHELMSMTDPGTVKTLELRVPGLCSRDREDLESDKRDGVLFPKIRDQRQRQNIWSNLMKVKCPIPTLYTLRKDTRYLRPLVGIMKRILGYPTKRGCEETLREITEQRFTGANQHEDQVQVQETRFTLTPYRDNLEDRVDLGVWKAWLYLMRHFTEMVLECPREEKGKPAPVPKQPKAIVWHHFAALMYRLGFASDEIHRLRQKDVDREKARDNLLEARDPEDYTYDEVDFESHQENMVKMYNTARKKEQLEVTSLLFVDEPGEDLERRCGRTFENAYEDDRKRLFLHVLCDSDRAGGRGITSLFVRISVCFVFFGRPVFSTGTRQAIEQGLDGQSTDLIAAPTGPGDLTRTPHQPRTSEPSTDAAQSIQPAGTSQRSSPAADSPQQNVVSASLREELKAAGHQMDDLRAQKATLEDMVSVKDKELADLLATQASLSRDLENRREELRKQSIGHESLWKANEKLEKDLSEARSEAKTHLSERVHFGTEITALESRLKQLGVEKVNLQEDKTAMESDLQGQVTRLEADKLALGSGREDAEKHLLGKCQDLEAEIDQLKAEVAGEKAIAEDLETEKQDLQAKMNQLKAENTEATT